MTPSRAILTRTKGDFMKNFTITLTLAILTALTACSSRPESPYAKDPEATTERECKTYWSPWSKLCANNMEQGQEMYMLDQEIAADWRKRVFFCAHGAAKEMCWPERYR